jgi:valyl-tRNA synthetase
MIMMGLRFMGDVPFREVYIHGLIRDAQGQKMSKSKGNVLDPIDLIDGIELEALVAKRTSGLMQPQMAPAIEKATRREFPDGIPAFGCDALRFTFASLATTGRDIRFDLGRIEGYRNFCNKLWNAARYVLMQTEGHAVESPGQHSVTDRWILSCTAGMLAEVETHITAYRMDLAAQALYEFVWNEYCDWYLELSKPALQEGADAEQNATRHTLLTVLETTLRALHPLVPFISEEIWQKLREPLALAGDSIMLQAWPTAPERDPEAEADIAWLQRVLLGIRQIRSELNLAPALALPVDFQGGSDADRERCERFAPYLAGLGRVGATRWVGPDADTSACAVALVDELRILIPLRGLVDVDAERTRIRKLLEKETAELRKSQAKMGNPKFVDKAPAEVVEQEKERLASHRERVAGFEEQLTRLQALEG